METMHAAGRRNLPPVPVPRAAVEVSTPVKPETSPASAQDAPVHDAPAGDAPASDESAQNAPVQDAAAQAPAAPDVSGDDEPPAPDVTAWMDAGQSFVARLRAAAPAFAAAAGAQSAVVREVVPPARHRRSRCRVVLRQSDGTETDLTFVGERRRPGASGQAPFDEQISEWLTAGQQRDPAWLVADPDASDGTAVDVTAWIAGA